MTNSLYKGVISSNLGFWFLMIAAVGDLLVPFFLAPFCSKYSHLTMVMSLLGNRNSPIHSVYNSWLVIAGVLFLLGNIKLYSAYATVSAGLSATLFVLIAGYAIDACILSGIFAVGETKELLTLSEKIHGYGSVLGFFLLTFAPLTIGILSLRSHQLLTGVASILCFVLAVIFFVLFVMADKEKFTHTIISLEGLWQRLTLLCMYTPIVIISYRNIH